MNSRRKGKQGELELAKFLREHGYTDAHRGQQFKGGGDSPDVVGIPGVHLECKRVEKGSLYDWLAQAQQDAAAGAMPVVAHRRSRKEWVAILSLTDFLKLIGRASREVPVGQSWAFTEHRTMAEVMRDEEAHAQPGMGQEAEGTSQRPPREGAGAAVSTT